MASDSVRALIDKIKKTRDPVKRMRLGLKFFTKSNNYVYDSIGWGEDYCPTRDMGKEVARTALQKFPRTKRGNL